VGFWCTALALAGLSVAACGGSATSPSTTSSSIGRYNMVSANGQPLPTVVSESPSTGDKQEVTGGYIDLRADQTTAWSTEYRYTDSGRTFTNSSGGEGRYTISGSTVTMTFGRDQLIGALTGNMLTVRADVVLVYRRQ